MSFLKVTAHLSSPLAGDAPHLDALLECLFADRQGLAHKCDRGLPAPEVAGIRIPLVRHTCAGQTVAKCSSPILAEIDHEGVEHFAKRLDVAKAELLHDKQRLVVAMGNATYKAYRLPLRIRVVDRVVWFASGSKGELRDELKSIPSLGKKRSQGYGRVHQWDVEAIADDWTWFADSPEGRVLMRPLPLDAARGAVGFVHDFGACQPPYWHPDRYQEIALPC